MTDRIAIKADRVRHAIASGYMVILPPGWNVTQLPPLCIEQGGVFLCIPAPCLEWIVA